MKPKLQNSTSQPLFNIETKSKKSFWMGSPKICKKKLNNKYLNKFYQTTSQKYGTFENKQIHDQNLSIFESRISAQLGNNQPSDIKTYSQTLQEQLFEKQKQLDQLNALLRSNRNNFEQSRNLFNKVLENHSSIKKQIKDMQDMKIRLQNQYKNNMTEEIKDKLDYLNMSLNVKVVTLKKAQDQLKIVQQLMNDLQDNCNDLMTQRQELREMINKIKKQLEFDI